MLSFDLSCSSVHQGGVLWHLMPLLSCRTTNLPCFFLLLYRVKHMPLSSQDDHDTLKRYHSPVRLIVNVVGTLKRMIGLHRIDTFLLLSASPLFVVVYEKRRTKESRVWLNTRWRSRG